MKKILSFLLVIAMACPASAFDTAYAGAQKTTLKVSRAAGCDASSGKIKKDCPQTQGYNYNRYNSNMHARGY